MYYLRIEQYGKVLAISKHKTVKEARANENALANSPNVEIGYYDARLFRGNQEYDCWIGVR